MTGKWYVMYKGENVNQEIYSAKTLSECLKLARVYKAVRELNTGRLCHGVYVAKCGGTPMQHCIDGTQAHYV